MKKQLAALSLVFAVAAPAFAAEQPTAPLAALAGIEAQALSAEEMDQVHGTRITLLDIYNTVLNTPSIPQVVKDRIMKILTTQSGLARRLRHIGDL